MFLTDRDMREGHLRQPGHKDAKLTYTRFPKDWTAEQIYEYLIAQAEEEEEAGDDESGEAGERGET